MTHPWPMRPQRDLTGSGPVTVLAPHPDDESLGCGLLLAGAFAGSGAHVVCLTDGSASHPGSAEWPPSALARRRRAELETAIARLGGSAADITWLGLPDGRLAECPARNVADRIAEIMARTGSTRVFATAIEDHHADHKATARIAALAVTVRPDIELFSYPVWSRWDDAAFDDTIRCHRPVSLDLEGHRDAKRDAVLAHRSQLRGGIADDPTGFAMEPGFIDRFVNEPEIFWRTRP